MENVSRNAPLAAVPEDELAADITTSNYTGNSCASPLSSSDVLALKQRMLESIAAPGPRGPAAKPENLFVGRRPSQDLLSRQPVGPGDNISALERRRRSSASITRLALKALAQPLTVFGRDEITDALAWTRKSGSASERGSHEGNRKSNAENLNSNSNDEECFECSFVEEPAEAAPAEPMTSSPTRAARGFKPSVVNQDNATRIQRFVRGWMVRLKMRSFFWTRAKLMEAVKSRSSERIEEALAASRAVAKAFMRPPEHRWALAALDAIREERALRPHIVQLAAEPTRAVDLDDRALAKRFSRVYGSCVERVRRCRVADALAFTDALSLRAAAKYAAVQGRLDLVRATHEAMASRRTIPIAETIRKIDEFEREYATIVFGGKEESGLASGRKELLELIVRLQHEEPIVRELLEACVDDDSHEDPIDTTPAKKDADALKAPEMTEEQHHLHLRLQATFQEATTFPKGCLKATCGSAPNVLTATLEPAASSPAKALPPRPTFPTSRADARKQDRRQTSFVLPPRPNLDKGSSSEDETTSLPAVPRAPIFVVAKPERLTEAIAQGMIEIDASRVITLGATETLELARRVRALRLAVLEADRALPSEASPSEEMSPETKAKWKACEGLLDRARVALLAWVHAALAQDAEQHALVSRAVHAADENELIALRRSAQERVVVEVKDAASTSRVLRAEREAKEFDSKIRVCISIVLSLNRVARGIDERMGVSGVLDVLSEGIRFNDVEKIERALDRGRALALEARQHDYALQSTLTKARAVIARYSSVHFTLKQALEGRERAPSALLRAAEEYRSKKFAEQFGVDHDLHLECLRLCELAERELVPSLVEAGVVQVWDEPELRELEQRCAALEGLGGIPELARVRELLAMPSERLLHEQLRAVTKLVRESPLDAGLKERRAELTLRLRRVTIETQSHAFTLDQFGGLMDPKEWAALATNGAWSLTAGRKRARLSEGMLVFSLAPIHAPLTRVEDKRLWGALRKTHLSIMGFMGDAHVSKGATGCEDGLLLLGEQMEHARRLNETLVLGLGSGGEVRDEIYVQIMKQLSENPSPSSVARGWNALALCLHTFPATPRLDYFLEAFIRNRASPADAESLLQTMHRMLFSDGPGERPTAPSAQEIFDGRNDGARLEGVAWRVKDMSDAYRW